MKKKILALVLCVAMLAIAVVGGTMAYFTDKEAATNVYTVGSVDIELYESTLHRDNDKATDDEIIADAADYQDYLAEAGKDMVPGRWVSKAPYIKNTGNNDAYVRIKLTMDENFLNVMDMMLYTTAFNAGAITGPTGPVDNGDGTVTYTFTYTEALEPDEMTYYAPFWQFKVADKLDQDDLAKADMIIDINHLIVTAEAIQAEGFADATAAFAAYDAQK